MLLAPHCIPIALFHSFALCSTYRPKNNAFTHFQWYIQLCTCQQQLYRLAFLKFSLGAITFDVYIPLRHLFTRISNCFYIITNTTSTTSIVGYDLIVLKDSSLF